MSLPFERHKQVTSLRGMSGTVGRYPFARPSCAATARVRDRFKESAMYPMMTPTQMIDLSMKTGMMLVEAQMVIGMRMMGMAGLWRVLPSENARMSSEKVSAISEVAIATSQAILSGKPPAVIAEAALTPVARATKSNVKRLARRGPGKPS